MSAQVDYDVLVIGAGSSGSVIAARLSENPNLRVALIEAGPDYANPAATPFDLINSHNNSYSDHDWGFEYQPTQHRSDLSDRATAVKPYTRAPRHHPCGDKPRSVYKL